jgi:hypothetical protein
MSFRPQDVITLTQLVDQRKRRGVRYPLAPLLTIAILAKLAGHSRLEDLADWAAAGQLAGDAVWP